jgi:hypothetical protein
MEAAAHTKGGFGGVPQKVGKEFAKADEGKKFKEGGLYANIHAKQQRISEGSGEKMRKAGSKGAPTAEAFRQSAKTVKKAIGGTAKKKPKLEENYHDVKVKKLPYMGEPADKYMSYRSLPVGAKTTSKKPSLNTYDRNDMNKGGGVKLSVGRGEKLSVDRGAGLTAKGRAKYNKETGSHLKAPQPQGGSRKDSFCARMSGVVEHSSGDAPRAKASLKRWKCPGW